MPLEWSFSENDPDAVRIEFQPFDPDMSASERLRRTTAAVTRAAESCYGEILAAKFVAAVDESAKRPDQLSRFGAFVGLVAHANRPTEFKIYVELSPGDETVTRSKLSGIVDLTPQFRSISVGPAQIAERDYFLCPDAVRLLDLEEVCARLDMRHRFPALLVMLLELTGGAFHLPPRSVLLGIRRGGGNLELKVELISRLTMVTGGLGARLERLIQPDAVPAFRRWLNIVHSGAPEDSNIRIISVRTSPQCTPRLSVYAV
jgi:hypothetical protein